MKRQYNKPTIEIIGDMSVLIMAGSALPSEGSINKGNGEGDHQANSKSDMAFGFEDDFQDDLLEIK